MTITLPVQNLPEVRGTGLLSACYAKGNLGGAAQALAVKAVETRFAVFHNNLTMSRTGISR